MCKLIVVIPAYNSKLYLRNAVISVLRQPCECHVIIVDDGSTDGTATLCDEIALEEAQVTVLHQQNAGVSCARNKGISFALDYLQDNSGYIAFCDADDAWKAGCITQEILNNALNQRADIIGFSCWSTDQEMLRYNVNNQYHTHTCKLSESGTVDGMLAGPFCAHLYSSSMISRYSLFFSENINRNEDVIFMRQSFFCASCIIYKEETLYLYRTNKYSATHQSTAISATMLNICRAWYSMQQWADTVDIPLSKKEAWQRMCLSTAAAVLLEAARGMAEVGYRKKQILLILTAEPYFSEIENLIVENLAAWQQPDLILFQNNYNAFFRKYKILGIIKKTAFYFMQFPVVCAKRDRMRFPYLINDEI